MLVEDRHEVMVDVSLSNAYEVKSGVIQVGYSLLCSLLR